MSWRKSSTASNDTSAGSVTSQKGVIIKPAYPYALALRIRVVQIVCGIAEVVMGSVAAIEERDQMNLSLGVPTGAVTVLAGAWSIHRSVHRDACGRRGGAWWTKIFWAVASSLQGALFVLAARTTVMRWQHGEDHTSDTSLWLSVIHGVLSSCTLVAGVMTIRIRCIYGSAPPLPGHSRGQCPRSTSHTGVSMVPLTSNYNYPAINDLYNKSADNLSSENETLELNVAENKSNDSDTPTVKNVAKNENIKSLAFKNDEIINNTKAKDVKSDCVKFLTKDIELGNDKFMVENEKGVRENGGPNYDKLNNTIT